MGGALPFGVPSPRAGLVGTLIPVDGCVRAESAGDDDWVGATENRGIPGLRYETWCSRPNENPTQAKLGWGTRYPVLFMAQNEKATCPKMRRAAEPVEKIPPASVVDWLKCGLPTTPLGPP